MGSICTVQKFRAFAPAPRFRAFGAKARGFGQNFRAFASSAVHDGQTCGGPIWGTGGTRCDRCESVGRGYRVGGMDRDVDKPGEASNRP